MMLFTTTGLRRAHTLVSARFIHSRLVGIENVQDYQPGGFHPIAIGDLFDNGRFRILHKLGYGGSSTVWLARDQRDGLVTLKALRADISAASQLPEVAISRKVQALQLLPSRFQTVQHHFSVHGANGTHTFLISPCAGPSVAAMYDCPGRIAGSRRLRADIARKVAKQAAESLSLLHHAGIVHGDVTTSNILFRPSSRVRAWSDAEVYAHLGEPETEPVRTRDGQPLGTHAPSLLVEPVENSKMTDASLLEDDVMLGDFGQAYDAPSPPPSYRPATLLHYMSPEARFAGQISAATDVWSLGCAIFEIRAGFALFEPFMASDATVLKDMVEILGRLPDPWWDAFEHRTLWFQEGGQPKSEAEQQAAGTMLMSRKTSLKEKLRQIGKNVDPASSDDGWMMETPEVPLDEEEVAILADLLEKMLRYRPDERISMADVIQHPWFAL